MNSKAVLQADSISKVFRLGPQSITVFNNIDLTVQAGERIAIVGSSGAGKSTLLHILGGLDKPTSGQVSIGNKNLSDISESAICQLRNRKLGFVYQFHHILPEFTVMENVAMPLLIRGEKPQICRDKARDLLAKVGLAKREQHKLAELSGGERSRTAIARALVSEPLCLLADEPTGNLDEATASQVYDIMLELNQAMKTALIIVTHDLNLAGRMEKVLKLHDGQLHQQ